MAKAMMNQSKKKSFYIFAMFSLAKGCGIL
jgi:hypothetical protein